ncbi:efflux RND transporter periplasmic adaptor subunit [Desulfolithobacter sp.]
MTDSRTNPSPDPILPDTPTPKRTTWQKALALCIILGLLAAGLMASRYTLHSRPAIKRNPPEKMQLPVQVLSLYRMDTQPIVQAMGTVIPSRELAVMSQVTGIVRTVHPNLVPGGRIRAGDILVAIDDRDYQLALERSTHNLEKVRMDLRLEEGSQAVARREFELIREHDTPVPFKAPADLILRKPQLAKARAALAAAETDVARARLDLERTRIRAPFNAVVLERNVTVGSLVSPQTTVARLAATDTFWVRLAVPHSALQAIDLPRGDEPGAPVALRDAADPKGPQVQGRILRMLGDIDPAGIMARLIVEVTTPLQGTPPLLLEQPVQALITGRTLKNCFRLPRTAVRLDNTVLLADQDNRLIIRHIEPVWRDANWVYVQDGLHEGDRLIVSPVAAPVEGITLSIIPESASPANG